MYITSVALIEDGKIIAAVPEERLTRDKHTRVFPLKAVEYCLAQANCKIEDIDYIANSYNPAIHMEKFNPIFSQSRRNRADYLYSIPDQLFRLIKNKEVKYLKQEIELNNNQLCIYYLDHHDCHAANAFFLSPFKKAAILTVDGRGEKDTCSFGLGQENNIRNLKRITLPHSLGSFYSTYTSFLGFRPDSDEWKVMALVALAQTGNNPFYEKIKNTIELCEQGEFRLDIRYYKEHFHEIPNYFTDELVKLIGYPRKKSEVLEQKHYQIAAAMQQVTEETILHMLAWLQEETQMENLTVAGGVFMNSVFNGKITRLSNFKNVFISSCPDDSGNSIGAALYLYHHILGKGNRCPQKHSYYGPEFDNSEIEKALDKAGLSYKKRDNIEEYSAKKISEGCLVGWFQGKTEFGQRALGNRSILADPRNPKIKDKINAAVKYREAFRPFAPAVLDKYARDYFDMDCDDVPFMEKVFPIKEDKRHLIPAVVHNDGSGRLQTVNIEINPRFYSLIEHFFRITGVPIVVNTSFNLNGEPIVCSPTDAIKVFYTCGLNILVLGDYVVEKESVLTKLP